MKITQHNVCYILLAVIVISSCSPVHYLTKVKRTPKEYVMNYCGQPIKAPSSEWIKEPWVVFSDRDNNHTTARPGGKVKVKEASFMEPFLVVGKDGDYLKLITYNQDIKNGYIKGKHKEAEFAGWIHQSKLILSRQAYTDLSSGLKNKYITVLSDTLALFDPDKYLTTDSLKTFRDVALKIDGKSVGLNQLVYVLKISPDNRKYLITTKQSVSVDNAAGEVIGWIPAPMVQLFGRRAYVEALTLPSLMLDTRQMSKNNPNKLNVVLEKYEENNLIRKEVDVYKYTPITSTIKTDDSLVFKTSSPIDIVDRSNNYLYNVNGNKITYKQYLDLNKKLENINVVFIIQGDEYTASQFTPIVNIIQNLQNFFENDPLNTSYQYKYGSVIAMGDDVENKDLSSCGLTSNYPELLEFLSQKGNIASGFKALPSQQTWSGIKKALDMLENYKTETNVLIVIGEKGSSKEVADKELIDRIGEYNCRLLAFQYYAKEGLEYNNFVLQMSDMIEQSAKIVSKTKRAKIVHADQVKEVQQFKEVEKNIYRLDFPNYSMTQGWLLFPEKDKSLPLSLLNFSIDSIIQEIKDENKILLTSLKNGFNSIGNNQSKYNTIVAKYNGIDTSKIINKAFLKKFSKQTPLFYLPARTGKISEDDFVYIHWILMLSKDESEELKNFLEELTMEEVDYVTTKSEQKKEVKKLCNCPDDDNLYLSFDDDVQVDTTKREYVSTKKIRKMIYKTYMRELNNCYYCKQSKKELEEYTLAQAHERIFGIPCNIPILTTYTVGDVKNKKVFSDMMLEKLIGYLKERKDVLEKQADGFTAFESGGQTYYWIDETSLP